MAKGKQRKPARRKAEGGTGAPAVEAMMNGCMGRMRSALRETFTKSQGVVQIEFNFIADRARVPPIILLNISSLVGKNTLTDEKVAQLTGTLGQRLSVDKQNRPNENVRLFLETDTMKVSRTDASDEEIRRQYAQHVLEGNTQHRTIADTELSPKPRPATSEDAAEPTAYESTVADEAARFKARRPEPQDTADGRPDDQIPAAPLPLADAISAALASHGKTDEEAGSPPSVDNGNISRTEAAKRIRRARRHGIEVGRNRAYEELGAATAKIARLEEELSAATEDNARIETHARERIAAINAQLQEAISADAFNKDRAATIGKQLAEERERAAEEKRTLDERIKTLMDEHQTALKGMRTEFTRLEERARKLEDELVVAREQGSEGVQARRELEGELDRLRTEADKTSKALAQAAEEVGRLHALGRGASSELRDLAASFARLKGEHDASASLATDLEQERSARVDLAEKVGRLEAQIAEHQDEIAQRERAVNAAKAEFEASLLSDRDKIKKRDAEIAKWGAVSDVLNDLSELLKDQSIIQNSRARTSLVSLILHYNRKISGLLKDPNSIFTMPTDADEILKQVEAIRTDLGAIRGALDEAETHPEEDENSPLQGDLDLEGHGNDIASPITPTGQVSAGSPSDAPLDTVAARVVDAFTGWFRKK